MELVAGDAMRAAVADGAAGAVGCVALAFELLEVLNSGAGVHGEEVSGEGVGGSAQSSAVAQAGTRVVAQRWTTTWCGSVSLAVPGGGASSFGRRPAASRRAQTCRTRGAASVEASGMLAGSEEYEHMCWPDSEAPNSRDRRGRNWSRRRPSCYPRRPPTLELARARTGWVAHRRATVDDRGR